MNIPSQLYRPSLALLTDFYELTMAYGYWKAQRTDLEAVFTYSFRQNPFHGGYTVSCGLEHAIDFLRNFRYDDADLAYLAGLRGTNERPLFDAAFIEYLRGLRFTCDVDAALEGTVVFPHEPVLRVSGPIVQAQILETPLLTILNFQTLIATKAARVCSAARGEPVIEFGLRRAQGIDGGLSATRAAYIGGCASTSNVLAGRLLGIPVRGTHAHSWVMSFDSELESFQAYAKAMPSNCVFLVDTYDTLEGVRRAVQVGHWLRANGHELAGVRLDSGDLAYFSIEARRILDEAGFPKAAIVASNELDEHIIDSLKEQGAMVNVWGVGTKLVTAYDQPALGGVYKLTAIRRPGEAWKHRIKLSEQAVKISTPGIQQVRRFERKGSLLGDMVYDVTMHPDGPSGPRVIIDPLDLTRRKRIPDDAAQEDLLRPIFRGGRPVYAPPLLEQVRAHVQRELARLHPSIKRFVNPHQYPVGLEASLHEMKTKLILAAREAQM